mmetsp:Transcript_13630/g.40630  ORF Transcript_13630/g.40630 Transcript_13630/m.40630 type:complete len:521 (+) Transcript_13630:174-1736(+)
MVGLGQDVPLPGGKDDGGEAERELDRCVLLIRINPAAVRDGMDGVVERLLPGETHQKGDGGDDRAQHLGVDLEVGDHLLQDDHRARGQHGVEHRHDHHGQHDAVELLGEAGDDPALQAEHVAPGARQAEDVLRHAHDAVDDLAHVLHAAPQDGHADGRHQEEEAGEDHLRGPRCLRRGLVVRHEPADRGEADALREEEAHDQGDDLVLELLALLEPVLLLGVDLAVAGQGDDAADVDPDLGEDGDHGREEDGADEGGRGGAVVLVLLQQAESVDGAEARHVGAQHRDRRRGRHVVLPEEEQDLIDAPHQDEHQAGDVRDVDPADLGGDVLVVDAVDHAPEQDGDEDRHRGGGQLPGHRAHELVLAVHEVEEQVEGRHHAQQAGRGGERDRRIPLSAAMAVAAVGVAVGLPVGLAVGLLAVGDVPVGVPVGAEGEVGRVGVDRLGVEREGDERGRLRLRDAVAQLEVFVRRGGLRGRSRRRRQHRRMRVSRRRRQHAGGRRLREQHRRVERILGIGGRGCQ